MSWGLGPFGAVPYGAGGSSVPLMALVFAEAVRENVVRLTFDQPVYYSRWHDPPDASFVQRYAIAADPSAIGIDGAPSRPVNVAAIAAVPGDGSQIDVWLDRPMSPTGSAYTITVVDLKSADLSTNLDPTQSSYTFSGVQLGRRAMSADMLIGNRDIANPQYGGTATNSGHPYGDGSKSLPQIGHFVVDDTGDYAIDQGLTSYKKRVFRRLTTPKGTFRALPSYGVIIPQSVKRLARANLTDSIAADAEDQIRREPETVNVSVALTQSPDDPELFIYKINAKTTIGVVTDYAVPVPIQG